MTEKPDKPNLSPIVNQLIEKSRAGKLKWQPTVNRDAFLVTVGGNTFRISRYDSTEINPWGNPDVVERVELELLDEKGKPLWNVYEREISGGLLRNLYDMARRIGNNIDERVAGALTALERL